MPATCAACAGPIVKGGDPFVIVGTEVVHRKCLGAQTKTTRLVLRLKDWRTTIKNLSAQLASAMLEVEDKRAQVSSMSAAMESMRKREIDKDLAIVNLRKAARDAEAREDEYRRQRDTFRRERDEARAQVEAARREAALHQTIQGATRIPDAKSTDTPPANDDRDPSEVRFSLLEIDGT